jgi:hypothetical protein
MHTKKQDENQRKRFVQGLYRKKKHKKRIKVEDNKIWSVFVGICVLIIFFFFITSVLFDIGVPLPSFFGR